MPFLKIPTVIQNSLDAHKKWMKLLGEAEILVDEDAELQRKAAKGLKLKERKVPPAVLGRLYAQYCDVINRMYDAYLSNVQLQRAPAMLDIVSVIWKRLYELRQELVDIIVNDYIYVDEALVSLKRTPQDIQIIVPYHYPLEYRSKSMEVLLQTMWVEADRRKSQELDKTKSENLDGFNFELSKTELKPAPHVIAEKSASTIIPEEFVQAIIIQTHERYRQYFIEDFKAKCRRRRRYFAEIVVEAPKHLRISAATLIQRVYRTYMKIKREAVLNHRRDVILGVVPDPFRNRSNLEEANNRLYERRRRIRHDLQEQYTKDMERERTRLILFKKDNQIEDITEHIQTWFQEWYYGYGFFPGYPYEAEGGTVMVIREDYPYVEEQIEEDEMRELRMKGKTKEMLKEEARRAKEDAKLKEELAREQKLKEEETYFKMRCNPLSDPGYQPQQSMHTGSISEALKSYRTVWSMYDSFPESYPSAVFGYMESILTEDLMNQLHIECRKYVDELMRLDLKLLIKMHQLMYKSIGKKYPKLQPRKKPKVEPTRAPFNINDKILRNIQIVFDLKLISKPTTKIKDIYGDLNYVAYDLNIRDPDVKFPPPGYGDIRRRLILSCVFGSGIESSTVRNKAVMLLGPGRNGKSFMVDAVCGELNAVKIDISPEVFSAVISRPGKALSDVFLAAKVFQPAVIFLKNIERVFAKKVPPEQIYLNAKSLKQNLTKLIKQISSDDKIMFIATCTDPFVAQAKPMTSIFSEVILVPRTDYGTLSGFFSEKFQRIRSMPVDYPVSSLAQVLQGYGFGLLIELYDKVMSADRILKLNVTPLAPFEFLEPLIEAEIEPVTVEEYQEYTDFFIANSPLRKAREEYSIINTYRAAVYEKLEKDEEKKAMK